MKDVIFLLSKTSSDKKEVISLVKKEYLKQGYINADSDECKIKIPKNSVIFAAKYNDKIIGTVSIFFDSGSGLPMDEIYSKELNELRSQNKKICEVGRLASDSDFLSKGSGFRKKYNSLFLISSLFKLVFHYCVCKKIDNIVISINPKHNLFYKSIFFKDIGGLKSYPSVNNAPALAKTLDVNSIKKKKNNYLFNKLF